MVTKSANTELIDYQIKTMTEKLSEHRDETNKRFDNQDKQLSEIKSLVKEGFSSLPDTYATKTDHKNNQSRLDKIDNIIYRVAWGFTLAFISTISIVIGIEKYL